MKEVFNYLDSILKTNDKLVIGVSGGMDSIALLDVVNKFKTKYNLKIIVAHINHNVRMESKEEALFVKKLCLNLGVIFESIILPKNLAGNFHSEAREKRYDFFLSLVHKYKANYLLTAHHGDDLVETILMRITRGSNLQGYKGFDVLNDYYGIKVLKPLIWTSKDQIKKYVNENNLEFREDASNEKDKYTRNRYRHNILNFLKKEDANVHLKFLKFSQLLNSYNAYFEKLVKKEMPKVYRKNTLDIEKLKKLNPLVQNLLLEACFYDLYNDELSLISDKHLKTMINLINSSEPNKQLNLPKGFIAYKSYNKLEFLKEKRNFKDFCFEFNQKLILNDDSTLYELKECTDCSNYVLRLNSSEVCFPLYVRNKKEGDKIEVKNLKGTKKIKDIFIDCKIDLEKRKQIPLLVDSKGKVLWILGLKKSKFDKKINEKYDILLKYDAKEDEDEKK